MFKYVSDIDIVNLSESIGSDVINPSCSQLGQLKYNILIQPVTPVHHSDQCYHTLHRSTSAFYYYLIGNYGDTLYIKTLNCVGSFDLVKLVILKHNLHKSMIKSVSLILFMILVMTSH